MEAKSHFQCQNCQASFAKKNLLDLHLFGKDNCQNKHTFSPPGKSRYTCKRCEKPFEYKSELIVHEHLKDGCTAKTRNRLRSSTLDAIRNSLQEADEESDGEETASVENHEELVAGEVSEVTGRDEENSHVSIKEARENLPLNSTSESFECVDDNSFSQSNASSDLPDFDLMLGDEGEEGKIEFQVENDVQKDKTSSEVLQKDKEQDMRSPERSSENDDANLNDVIQESASVSEDEVTSCGSNKARESDHQQELMWCLLCGFDSNAPSVIKEHIRNTHFGKISAFHTFFTFKAGKKEQALNSVLTYDQEEGLYHCPLCPYTCKPRQHMITHFRSHSGELPFQCKLCKDLKRHQHLMVHHIWSNHEEAVMTINMGIESRDSEQESDQEANRKDLCVEGTMSTQPRQGEDVRAVEDVQVRGRHSSKTEVQKLQRALTEKMKIVPSGSHLDTMASGEILEDMECQTTEEVYGDKEVKVTGDDVSGDPDIKATEEVSGDPEIEVNKEVSVDSKIKATEEVSGDPENKATEEVSGDTEIKATEEVSGDPEIKATDKVSGDTEIKAPEVFGDLEDTSTDDEIFGGQISKAIADALTGPDSNVTETFPEHPDRKSNDRLSGEPAIATEEDCGDKMRTAVAMSDNQGTREFGCKDQFIFATNSSTDVDENSKSIPSLEDNQSCQKTTDKGGVECGDSHNICESTRTMTKLPSTYEAADQAQGLVEGMKDKEHQLSHSECLICGFRSPSSLAVDEHIRKTHWGTSSAVSNFFKFKPGKKELKILLDKKAGHFKCPYCAQRAKQRGNMLSHIRLHSGELPYRCKLCGHQDRQQNVIARHVWNTHEDTVVKHNIWVQSAEEQGQDGVNKDDGNQPIPKENGFAHLEDEDDTEPVTNQAESEENLRFAAKTSGTTEPVPTEIDGLQPNQANNEPATSQEEYAVNVGSGTKTSLPKEFFPNESDHCQPGQDNSQVVINQTVNARISIKNSAPLPSGVSSRHPSETNHDASTKTVPEPVLSKCEICGFQKDVPSVISHIQRSHMNSSFIISRLSTFKTGKKEKRMDLKKNKGSGLYECPYCDKTSSTCRNSKQNMTVHIRNHTGEHPYKCSLCDFEGKSQSSMVHHIWRKHKTDAINFCMDGDVPDTIQSTKLDQSAANGALLEDVRKPGTDKAEVRDDNSCHSSTSKDGDHCHPSENQISSSFGEKQNIDASSLNKCTCKVCGFKDEMASVVDHVSQIHSGSIPGISKLYTFTPGQKERKLCLEKDAKSRFYKCPYCTWKSNRLAQVIRHVRCHTGEKPYECSLCGVKSSRKYRIAQHIWNEHEATAINVCILDVADGVQSTRPDVGSDDKKPKTGGKQREALSKSTGDWPTPNFHGLPGEAANEGTISQTEREENVSSGTRTPSAVDSSPSQPNAQPAVSYAKSARDPSQKDNDHGQQMEANDKAAGHQPESDKNASCDTKTSASVDSDWFSCHMCGFSNKSPSVVKDHILGNHFSSSRAVSKLYTFKCGKQEKMLKLKKDANSRLVHCPYCPKKTSTTQHMKYHLRSHTGEKPYRCKLCGLKTNQQGPMVRHVWVMHRESAINVCINIESPSTVVTQRSSIQPGATKEKAKEPEDNTEFSTKDKVNEPEDNTEVSTKDEANEPEESTEVSTKDKASKPEESTDVPTKDKTNDLEDSTEVSTKDKVNELEDSTEVLTKDKAQYPNEDKVLTEDPKTSEPLNSDWFSCRICEFSNKSASIVKQHILQSHFPSSVAVSKFFTFKCGKQEMMLKLKRDANSRLVHCPYCPKKTSITQQMKYHIRTHTGEKPYQCTLCSCKSSRHSAIARHIWAKHKTSAIDVCMNIESHSTADIIRNRIQPGVDESSDKRKVFPESPNEDSTKVSTNDNANEHEDNTKGSTKDRLKDPKTSGSLESCWYKCCTCGFGDKSASIVKDHILKSHFRSSVAVSKLYTFQCGKQEKMLKLKKDANSRLVHCPYCPKKTSTKHNMKYHIRTHTGEKPYACKLCSNKTTQQGLMARHIWSMHRTSAINVCMNIESRSTAGMQRSSIQPGVDKSPTERNVLPEGPNEDNIKVSTNYKANEHEKNTKASIKDKVHEDRIEDDVKVLTKNKVNSLEGNTKLSTKDKPNEVEDNTTVPTEDKVFNEDKVEDSTKEKVDGFEENTRLSTNVKIPQDPNDDSKMSSKDELPEDVFCPGKERKVGSSDFDFCRCQTCGFQSELPSVVENHIIESHHGSSVAVSKLFMCKPAKQQQMKLKRDSKSGLLRCPFCPKEMYRLQHMKIHIRKHTGERPYSCKLCSHTTSRSDKMAHHIWSVHKASAIKNCMQKEQGNVAVAPDGSTQPDCDEDWIGGRESQESCADGSRDKECTSPASCAGKVQGIQLLAEDRIGDGESQDSGADRCCDKECTSPASSAGQVQGIQLLAEDGIGGKKSQDSGTDRCPDNECTYPVSSAGEEQEIQLLVEDGSGDSESQGSGTDRRQDKDCTTPSRSTGEKQGIQLLAEDGSGGSESQDSGANGSQDKVCTSPSSGAGIDQGIFGRMEEYLQHLHPSLTEEGCGTESLGGGEHVENCYSNVTKMTGEQSDEKDMQDQQTIDVNASSSDMTSKSVEHPIPLSLENQPLGKLPLTDVDILYSQSSSEMIMLAALLKASESCCPYCDKRFSSAEDVVLHCRQHTGEEPYQCMHCEYKSSHKQPMVTHVRSQHKDKAPPTNYFSLFNFKTVSVVINVDFKQDPATMKYICCHCQKESESLIQARLHGRHHTKPYRCNTCQFTASGRPAMLKHIEEAHPDLMENSGEKELNTEEKVANASEITMVCTNGVSERGMEERVVLKAGGKENVIGRDEDGSLGRKDHGNDETESVKAESEENARFTTKTPGSTEPVPTEIDSMQQSKANSEPATSQAEYAENDRLGTKTSLPKESLRNESDHCQPGQDDTEAVINQTVNASISNKKSAPKLSGVHCRHPSSTNHDSLTEMIPEPVLCKCKICGFQKDVPSVIAHIQHAHMNSSFIISRLSTFKPGKKEQKLDLKKDDESGLFECPYCNKTDSYKNNVRVHIRIHTGEHPYKCGLCDFEAKRQYCMVQHIWRKHKTDAINLCVDGGSDVPDATQSTKPDSTTGVDVSKRRPNRLEVDSSNDNYCHPSPKEGDHFHPSENREISSNVDEKESVEAEEEGLPLERDDDSGNENESQKEASEISLHEVNSDTRIQQKKVTSSQEEVKTKPRKQNCETLLKGDSRIAGRIERDEYDFTDTESDGEDKATASENEKSSEEEPEENWVQCDSCSKWRQLPTDVSVDEIMTADTWYCNMNPDESFNKCKIPEQAYDKDEVCVYSDSGQRAESGRMRKSPNMKRKGDKRKTSNSQRLDDTQSNEQMEKQGNNSRFLTTASMRKKRTAEMDWCFKCGGLTFNGNCSGDCAKISKKKKYSDEKDSTASNNGGDIVKSRNETRTSFEEEWCSDCFGEIIDGDCMGDCGKTVKKRKHGEENDASDGESLKETKKSAEGMDCCLDCGGLINGGCNGDCTRTAKKKNPGDDKIESRHKTVGDKEVSQEGKRSGVMDWCPDCGGLTINGECMGDCAKVTKKRKHSEDNVSNGDNDGEDTRTSEGMNWCFHCGGLTINGNCIGDCAKARKRRKHDGENSTNGDNIGGDCVERKEPKRQTSAGMDWCVHCGGLTVNGDCIGDCAKASRKRKHRGSKVGNRRSKVTRRGIGTRVKRRRRCNRVSKRKSFENRKSETANKISEKGDTYMKKNSQKPASASQKSCTDIDNKRFKRRRKVEVDASTDIIKLNHDYRVKYSLAERKMEQELRKTGSKQCPYCHKAFTSNSNVIIHTRIHTGASPFVCLHCNQRCATRQNLLVHIVNQHWDKSSAVLNKYTACCDNKGKSKLGKHLCSGKEKKPFYCVLCSSHFKNRHGVKQHIIIHHGKVVQKEVSELQPLPSSFSTSNKSRKSCTNTGRRQRSLGDGDGESCVEGKLFKADMADKKADKKVDKVSSEKYPQQGDGSEFIRKPEDKSVLKKTRTAPLSANTYDKIIKLNHDYRIDDSKAERNLAKELKSSRSKQCPYCDKKFCDTFKVIIHCRIHLGANPYVCLHCQHRCAHKQHMAMHIVNQHWEQSIATKVFGNMTGHCENETRTSRMKQIQKHSCTKQKIKPVYCVVCSLHFRDASNVKQHILLHHGEVLQKQMAELQQVESPGDDKDSRSETEGTKMSCESNNADGLDQDNVTTDEIARDVKDLYKLNGHDLESNGSESDATAVETIVHTVASKMLPGVAEPAASDVISKDVTDTMASKFITAEATIPLTSKANTKGSFKHLTSKTTKEEAEPMVSNSIAEKSTEHIASKTFSKDAAEPMVSKTSTENPILLKTMTKDAAQPMASEVNDKDAAEPMVSKTMVDDSVEPNTPAEVIEYMTPDMAIDHLIDHSDQTLNKCRNPVVGASSEAGQIGTEGTQTKLVSTDVTNSVTAGSSEENNIDMASEDVVGCEASQKIEEPAGTELSKPDVRDIHGVGSNTTDEITSSVGDVDAKENGICTDEAMSLVMTSEIPRMEGGNSAPENDADITESGVAQDLLAQRHCHNSISGNICADTEMGSEDHCSNKEMGKEDDNAGTEMDSENHSVDTEMESTSGDGDKNCIVDVEAADSFLEGVLKTGTKVSVNISTEDGESVVVDDDNIEEEDSTEHVAFSSVSTNKIRVAGNAQDEVDSDDSAATLEAKETEADLHSHFVQIKMESGSADIGNHCNFAVVDNNGNTVHDGENRSDSVSYVSHHSVSNGVESDNTETQGAREEAMEVGGNIVQIKMEPGTPKDYRYTACPTARPPVSTVDSNGQECPVANMMLGGNASEVDPNRSIWPPDPELSPSPKIANERMEEIGQTSAQVIGPALQRRQMLAHDDVNQRSAPVIDNNVNNTTSHLKRISNVVSQLTLPAQRQDTVMETSNQSENNNASQKLQSLLLKDSNPRQSPIFSNNMFKTNEDSVSLQQSIWSPVSQPVAPAQSQQQVTEIHSPSDRNISQKLQQDSNPKEMLTFTSDTFKVNRDSVDLRRSMRSPFSQPALSKEQVRNAPSQINASPDTRPQSNQTELSSTSSPNTGNHSQSSWSPISQPTTFNPRPTVDFIYEPSSGEKLIWDEQILQCPVCSVEMTSTKDVMSHMRESHTLETPFRCCHCMFSAMNLSTMVDHVNRLHPASLFDLCHSFHICQWDQTAGNGTSKPCSPKATGKAACCPLSSDDEFYHCSKCSFKSFQLPLMADHVQKTHKKCLHVEVDPLTRDVVCPVCLHHWDDVKTAMKHRCTPAMRNMPFAYGNDTTASGEQRPGVNSDSSGAGNGGGVRYDDTEGGRTIDGSFGPAPSINPFTHRYLPGMSRYVPPRHMPYGQTPSENSQSHGVQPLSPPPREFTRQHSSSTGYRSDNQGVPVPHWGTYMLHDYKRWGPRDNIARDSVSKRNTSHPYMPAGACQYPPQGGRFHHEGGQRSPNSPQFPMMNQPNQYFNNRQQNTSPRFFANSLHQNLNANGWFGWYPPPGYPSFASTQSLEMEGGQQYMEPPGRCVSDTNKVPFKTKEVIPTSMDTERTSNAAMASDDERSRSRDGQQLPVILNVTSLNNSWKKDFVGSREK